MDALPQSFVPFFEVKFLVKVLLGKLGYHS